MIAERLALPGRHDRHRIAPVQHSANDLFLAWPELRKAELFAELSRQIIHGEIVKTLEGWETWCEGSIEDRLTVGKSNEPRWEDQLSTLRFVSETDGWGTDLVAGQAV